MPSLHIRIRQCTTGQKDIVAALARIRQACQSGELEKARVARIALHELCDTYARHHLRIAGEALNKQETTAFYSSQPHAGE